jgi:peptide alpha-N-acetyltransferase
MINPYVDETQLPTIMQLISQELSEPYTIYTYRYFLHTWPNLTFTFVVDSRIVGIIICRIEPHIHRIDGEKKRGYIAMLVVDKGFRKKGIAKQLVVHAIRELKNLKADEVVLETEASNIAALNLYHRLGFVKDKRLNKYYLNGVDAFRLKLFLNN